MALKGNYYELCCNFISLMQLIFQYCPDFFFAYLGVVMQEYHLSSSNFYSANKFPHCTLHRDITHQEMIPIKKEKVCD